jgi:hypothetical protein
MPRDRKGLVNGRTGARRRRAGVTLAGCAVAAALAFAPASPAAAAVTPAPATATATATFAVTSDWGSGFVANYVLHNGAASPTTSWRLEFDLPDGELLTSAWGALIARSGQHYVLTPVAYTKTIGAGATIKLGLQGTVAVGPFAPPTSCLFNGLPCGGGTTKAASGSAPVVPTVPTDLAAASLTPTAVTLSWSPSSDALGVTSYDVYRGNVKVATTIGPSATVGGLDPNTAYTFSVRAVDAGANVSAASTPLAVRTPSPAPSLNGALTADVATINDWGTGYVGSVVIRNRSVSPVSGWQVALDLPAGTTLNTAWNAGLAVAGSRATLTPAFWTKTIAPGGSVYVGFQGTADGPFPGIAGCTVNGVSCGRTATTPISSAPSTASAAPSALAHGRGSGATAASFAPYVDMTLTPPFPMATVARAGTIKHATLAFVVSGAPCQAAWGGVTALNDPSITSSIAALRAAGGSAIVSFGGQAGQELAQTCTSVGALAAQYQSVIDQYAIRDLDFDVEGAAEADLASVTRRSQAIAQLQSTGKAARKPVHVSLTLAVTPAGLTADGLRVVRNAIANHVDVGTVNVMAMDYYDPALNVAGHMGDLAIAAARATHRQLARLYPRRSSAAVWKMVGVTPMLGINDNPKEIFTTADAAKLTAFARRHRIGRLALWSANRDAPCAQPEQHTSNLCSGVSDPPWAFAKVFGGFPGR